MSDWKGSRCVNVPGAPLIAEVRTKRGDPYAVLVNRSKSTVVSIVVGTVAISEGGMQIGCEIEEYRIDQGVKPGAWWEGVLPLANQKSPAMIAAEKGCTGDLRYGLVRATFADGSTWSATEPARIGES